MKTRLDAIGETLFTAAWPLLFVLAILPVAIGRLLGLGEREASTMRTAD